MSNEKGAKTASCCDDENDEILDEKVGT